MGLTNLKNVQTIEVARQDGEKANEILKNFVITVITENMSSALFGNSAGVDINAGVVKDLATGVVLTPGELDYKVVTLPDYLSYYNLSVIKDEQTVSFGKWSDTPCVDEGAECLAKGKLESCSLSLFKDSFEIDGKGLFSSPFDYFWAVPTECETGCYIKES
jgi:hypothetical protein